MLWTESHPCVCVRVCQAPGLQSSPRRVNVYTHAFLHTEPEKVYVVSAASCLGDVSFETVWMKQLPQHHLDPTFCDRASPFRGGVFLLGSNTNPRREPNKRQDTHTHKPAKKQTGHTNQAGDPKKQTRTNPQRRRQGQNPAWAWKTFEGTAGLL